MSNYINDNGVSAPNLGANGPGGGSVFGPSRPMVHGPNGTPNSPATVANQDGSGNVTPNPHAGRTPQQRANWRANHPRTSFGGPGNSGGQNSVGDSNSV